MSDRRLLIAFLFTTLILLLLRDVPYINVYIINKLWVAYVLLILVIVFFFIPRKESYLWGTLFFLPFIALIFTLLRIKIAAEVIGVVLFLILWLAVLLKIISFVREKDNGDK